MHNKLNTLSILLVFSLVLLHGCGGGQNNNPNNAPIIDTDAPSVSSTFPSNNNIIEVSQAVFRLTFDEAIHQESIDNIASIINITPSIPGIWDYNASTKAFTLTRDNSSMNALPYNQRYTIRVSQLLKDTNNNRLAKDFEINFSTTRTYSIAGNVNNLHNNQSIKLSLTIDNAEASTVTLTNDNDGSLSFQFDDNRINTEAQYTLAVTQQPTSGQYCVPTKSEGKINNTNIITHIDCSEVLPQYPNQPNWNDYVDADDGSQCLLGRPCQHAGEYRHINLPDITTCDNIIATDTLNAFDWQCHIVNDDQGSHVHIQTQQLASNANLTQLIEFESLTWKKNQVTVVNNMTQLTLLTTYLAVWWNNPIMHYIGNVKLDQSGAIYVVADSDTKRNINITSNSIALVTRPFTDSNQKIEFRAAGSGPLVKLSSNYAWIEGVYNATSTTLAHDNIILVENTRNTVLRNLIVLNADKDGISINDSEHLRLSNVASYNNEGSGIKINTTSQHNKLSNIKTVGNTEHGLVIIGSNNTVETLVSGHNKGNGIQLAGAKNRLLKISSFNNSLAGINLQDKSNNLITQAYTVSNGSHGLVLADTSSHTIILNISSLYNAGTGIVFEDDTSNNTLVNINASFNGETNLSSNTHTTNTLIAQVLIDQTAISANTLFVGIADITSPNTVYPTANWANTTRHQTWGNLATQNGETTTGKCSSPTIQACQLWDWQLLADEANVYLNALTLNTTETITHQNNDNSSITFLTNAVEIHGDTIGNDNGLCEVDEACITSTNIGAYLGHGELQALDGDFYTLYQYATNGVLTP